MTDENIRDVITRYLQDAIAAENSFESQLRAFSKEGNSPGARALFEQHAEDTRSQIQRLTTRLKDLGGTPSAVKSFMAHLFGMAPKTASIGHHGAERVAQNLIMAYTVEQAEVAMYEALATLAEAAGDGETAALAREIQHEEERAARKLWPLISLAAVESISKLTSAASG